MNTPEHWLYPSSLKEAEVAQHEMAQKVVLEDGVQDISLIGGMDVSCNLYDPNQMIYAAAVVLSYPKMTVQETQSAAQKQRFPYVPGFLGFREAPALVEGFKKLEHKPQLLFVDGHGISHPRGLGIASHLGVLLDIPTIGVAKSILVGHLDQPLGKEAGSRALLVWKDKTIAAVLRSKKGSNPLLISVGHKVSLETAVKLVQDSLRGYRLPEPTRQAHIAANACRKEHSLLCKT